MTGSPVFLAVALSLVSAICYAAAAVVQERTAADTTSVRGALARGAWWGSVLLNASGALLHVVALRYGPLTLVQPLGALSLVLAVPLGSLVSGRRTSGSQWNGMAFTLLGLTTLLAVTASGRGDTLDTTGVLLVALVAAAAVTLLSARGGLAVAAASGIASGAGSTLAQKLAVGPTLSWSTALVALLTVAFAVGGLLLSQKAYRHGLGGPLALLTLVNPVTAAAIGITLLGEGFRYGPTGTLLALAAAAAAIHGVTLLSRPDATPAGVAGQEVDRVGSLRPVLVGASEAAGEGVERVRRAGSVLVGGSGAAGQDVDRVGSLRPVLIGGSQDVDRARRAGPALVGVPGAAGQDVGRVGSLRPVVVGAAEVAGEGVDRARRAGSVSVGGPTAAGQAADRVEPLSTARVGRSAVGREVDRLGPARPVPVGGPGAAGQDVDRVEPPRPVLVGGSDTAGQDVDRPRPPRPVLLGSPHLEQNSGRARPALPAPAPPVRTEPLRPLPVSVGLTGASRAM
jgi:drug/metabolite transporter (DMT)-like permease